MTTYANRFDSIRESRKSQESITRSRSHFLTVCSIAPLSVLSRECQCIIDRSKCPPRVTERADSAIRFAADLQLRVDKEFSFVGHFRNKPTIVSSVPAVSGLFGIRIAVH